MEGWNRTRGGESVRMSRDGKDERDEEKIEIRLSESRGSYLFSPNGSRRIENPDVRFYPMMLSLKWL